MSKSTPNFATRLARTSGRIVGVTTVNGRKFNGQVRNVSPNYVTMYDRNQRKQVKFALSSIQSVSGV